MNPYEWPRETLSSSCVPAPAIATAGANGLFTRALKKSAMDALKSNDISIVCDDVGLLTKPTTYCDDPLLDELPFDVTITLPIKIEAIQDILYGFARCNKCL